MKEGFLRRSRSAPIGFHLVPALYLAAAAGSVRLRSPRPEDPPELDYNLLGEPVDRERMREGVRIAVELLRHASFRPLVAEVVNPTPAELASDAALDDWLLRTTATSHHVSSTCRMGAAGDPDSVVDQERTRVRRRPVAGRGRIHHAGLRAGQHQLHVDGDRRADRGVDAAVEPRPGAYLVKTGNARGRAVTGARAAS